MSKVKPILYMFGKGGISVLQTSIFNVQFLTSAHTQLSDNYIYISVDEYVHIAKEKHGYNTEQVRFDG